MTAAAERSLRYMTRARFTREMRGGEVGPDVEGVGRALARAGFLSGLPLFMSKLPAFRRTYNQSKRDGVNRARAKIKLPQNGVYNRQVHEYLERLDAFDPYAQKLMLDWAPAPTLVFPFGVDAHITICQRLHETGGLPGNWAIDFCCVPGTGILAPERATVTRFSGHPPSDDHSDALGIFGWTTYLQTPKGYLYFITHQGSRTPSLKVGMRVEAGDLLGWVGNQRYRPDHLHLGVSSPLGPSDAKRRIVAVSQAGRIH